MNSAVTYKLTKRLQRALAQQLFWPGAAISLMIHAIGTVVVCWVCGTVISQLYRFFSRCGVADVWYHVFVSLPIALTSVPVLIQLVKVVMRIKRGYSKRMHESWPLGDDVEVDVEIMIDDDGIERVKGFGELKRLKWEEMTFACAVKDFYVFGDEAEVFAGIPKDAVDAELDEYLKDKMKIINKKLKDRKRDHKYKGGDGRKSR